MDLNYLYHRDQVSLFTVANAAFVQARHVHRELADRCAARIADAKTSVLPAAVI